MSSSEQSVEVSDDESEIGTPREDNSDFSESDSSSGSVELFESSESNGEDESEQEIDEDEILEDVPDISDDEDEEDEEEEEEKKTKTKTKTKTATKGKRKIGRRKVEEKEEVEFKIKITLEKENGESDAAHEYRINLYKKLKKSEKYTDIISDIMARKITNKVYMASIYDETEEKRIENLMKELKL